MEEEEVKPDDQLLPIKPTVPDLFTKLVFLQADLIYNTIAFLFSPILNFLSLLIESYHRAEEAKRNVQAAVSKVPSTITHGSTLLVKKFVHGFVAAVYMGMAMAVLFVVAVVLGVGLVRLVVEEPVFIRERLQFDYTHVNPKAVFFPLGVAVDQGGHYVKKIRPLGIPVDHTFHVSLLLLMPESDFNRDFGMFQLSAELVSTDGTTLQKSSQPCMLRFRSWPVRLTRTFLMSFPLVLGISSETQKISTEVLSYKEGYPRSGGIIVTMIPRAGTSTLPQLYEAEIRIQSRLPWTIQLVHRWKWTYYVWTSFNLYILFLVIFISCWKQSLFPASTRADVHDYDEGDIVIDERHGLPREGRHETTAELLRKWREMRNRRKSMFMHRGMRENVGSSTASSISDNLREDMNGDVEEEIGESISDNSREYMNGDVEEQIGDSESVCFEGSFDE